MTNDELIVKRERLRTEMSALYRGVSCDIFTTADGDQSETIFIEKLSKLQSEIDKINETLKGNGNEN